MNADQAAYEELSYYTLTHRDTTFIHQHVVDAYAAQTANAEDKPIKLAFALIGLYLGIEKQFTGRQVQRVHMQIGRDKRAWPVFTIPQNRGFLTVQDVVAVPAGEKRDAMIHQWCASVWEAYQAHQPVVENLLQDYQIL